MGKFDWVINLLEEDRFLGPELTAQEQAAVDILREAEKFSPEELGYLRGDILKYEVAPHEYAGNKPESVAYAKLLALVVAIPEGE